MEDVDYFGRTLAGLKAWESSLAIDDFGTGYSSLSYLKRFPVDAVKVDRAFVDGLGTDPHDSALVAAIVAMADALGLEVTAEGVETQDQLANLKRLQCRRAQGFYLARPMPAAAMTRLVAESHRWHQTPRPREPVGGRSVMPSEQQLSDVLSEFARTMVTDFPIQAILDHLVERIVDVLPITAAGVTLISPGTDPRYVAASDESAMRFEELQTELGEGPCLAAYRTGEAVAVADLRDESRFPKFVPRALEAGLVAVFTFPLRNGDDQLGALDLYRRPPGRWTPPPWTRLRRWPMSRPRTCSTRRLGPTCESPPSGPVRRRCTTR